MSTTNLLSGLKMRHLRGSCIYPYKLHELFYSTLAAEHYSGMDFEDDESIDDGPECEESDDSEEDEWWREDESEEDMYSEQEIEEHEYTISGDTARVVKIRLSVTDEAASDFEWMKNFVAECTCDRVAVASALARYINRQGIHSKFWERMEEPSEDMCDVAFHVFDRYGTVQAKYRDHPVQRGTGIWSDELDDGPLFLVEQVHITAVELRRKGLGRKIVSLLLDKANEFCESEMEDYKRLFAPNEAFERQPWTLHALASPGTLTAETRSLLFGKSPEERLMINTRIEFGAIDFFRSCGFRRIGASRCFAFSFDRQHASHALAAASDCDPRRNHAEDLECEELQVMNDKDCSTEEVKTLKMERLRDSLPLHHAALTLPDEELNAFFATHADDKIGWDRVNNSEATLLHVTACELKPLSTRWLLENPPHAESWKATRDLDGYTPLEALQETLEKIRTEKEYGGGWLRILDMSDQFTGYPDAAVYCLSLLYGRDILVPNDACLRYGCTCGECLDGVLSARMQKSLVLQGAFHHDLTDQDINDGGLWTMCHDHTLVYLDPDVRRNLGTNKSLRQGFVNMFQIAVECLEAKRVPTAENLEWWCNNRREWPPHTKNYLRRAGTRKGCWAVLRYMFDIAQSEDEKAGDGESQRFWKTEWSGLPTCRNDHEFEFVAWACGYGGNV
ncbi:hypothetical protein FE257_006936 [Aspergillus nanangensis]|uniref:Uncharacterized protein n=1 Tax=Aspergillus nanangensis TaxID=2582783 RepID=A0AAD4CNP7_ASPNN|nr:hypothetical protein FE257_006936 [Aspergillus nanangensis]